MIIFEDITKRWRIVTDIKKPVELRVFAGLELFCFPISVLTLVIVPFLILNHFFWGYQISSFLNIVIKIMLAAATGYITNYIAVEMLFKPYHKTKRHILSVLTFGYWSQGLIPRNKSKIGRQLGDEAEILIPPDKIADDLCKMITGLFENDKNLESVEKAIREFLLTKEDVIVSTCQPIVENVCVLKISEFITEERVILIWKELLKPKFTSEETKTLIVTRLVEYVNAKVPDIIPSLKEDVRLIIYRFLSRNELFQIISVAASVVGCANAARSLADNIVDEAVDWDEVSEKICNRIGSGEVRNKLSDEIVNVIVKIERWLESDEGVCKVQDFVKLAREKMSDYVLLWVKENFSKIVRGAIRSEGIWEYVRRKLMPAVREPLEIWLRGSGKDLVLAKLNLSERISSAVNLLSVEQFHERVNTIAAQHLGAIQVLGYFLGAIVGVGLLAIS